MSPKISKKILKFIALDCITYHKFVFYVFNFRTISLLRQFYKTDINAISFDVVFFSIIESACTDIV